MINEAMEEDPGEDVDGGDDEGADTAKNVTSYPLDIARADLSAYEQESHDEAEAVGNQMEITGA
jgi:hypothetical protein